MPEIAGENGDSSPRTAGGRVIVIGSINEDSVITTSRLPTPGETVPGSSLRSFPGGKGANQAVAAARARGSVHLVGAIGADPAGVRARDSLLREGVGISELLVDPDAPTGVAVVLVADDGENEIVVVAGANAVLDASLVSAALGRLAPRPPDVLVVGFEVGDSAVLAAAAWATETGCLLVLNPAPARALASELVQAGPILVPNANEARLLSGEHDVDDATRGLAATTHAPVITTVGSRGVVIVDGGQLTRIPPMQVDAIDTTGAGDTFTGVLAVGLAEGWTVRRSAERAVLAAAISVTTIGARSASPTAAAIEAHAQALDGLDDGVGAGPLDSEVGQAR